MDKTMLSYDALDKMNVIPEVSCPSDTDHRRDCHDTDLRGHTTVDERLLSGRAHVKLEHGKQNPWTVRIQVHTPKSKASEQLFLKQG